ncbi:hypothetical protein SBOR_3005 [Sclerotinia borealis F-4128]|uniref:Uncharacterized protein n=1 Tax=Sclerotinia borealis (strain F-4128) TaxID=1432307 RepID=W9CKV3_SCLBF|nr:hypothetical protein SBOR_3005 [Sclerotinia borealis F-4128]
MAKSQAANGVSKIPNKGLYSRISYLYQAATYLAVQENESQKQPSKEADSDYLKENVMQCESKIEASLIESCQPLSRRLVSDLRSVSLKGLIRMSPDMKHSICKKCQTLLMEGTTCTAQVENQSKGGKKPWADVLKGSQGDHADQLKKLKLAYILHKLSSLVAIKNPSAKRSFAMNSFVFCAVLDATLDDKRVSKLIHEYALKEATENFRRGELNIPRMINSAQEIVDILQNDGWEDRYLNHLRAELGRVAGCGLGGVYALGVAAEIEKVKQEKEERQARSVIKTKVRDEGGVRVKMEEPIVPQRLRSRSSTLRASSSDEHQVVIKAEPSTPSMLPMEAEERSKGEERNKRRR